MDNTM